MQQIKNNTLWWPCQVRCSIAFKNGKFIWRGLGIKEGFIQKVMRCSYGICNSLPERMAFAQSKVRYQPSSCASHQGQKELAQFPVLCRKTASPKAPWATLQAAFTSHPIVGVCLIVVLLILSPVLLAFTGQELICVGAPVRLFVRNWQTVFTDGYTFWYACPLMGKQVQISNLDNHTIAFLTRPRPLSRHPQKHQSHLPYHPHSHPPIWKQIPIPS
ncbi:hypothetical protein J437_LFUL018629 [Ladona fulva]|uniref:Uncharacterized protein n=1 Tax=Ladona fulva TaxID=123851 RepID=A0A8K0KQF7_LADFU|nr:hypothetical protein J437_LFUL018629 [Ladona fulva]